MGVNLIFIPKERIGLALPQCNSTAVLDILLHIITELPPEQKRHPLRYRAIPQGLLYCDIYPRPPHLKAYTSRSYDTVFLNIFKLIFQA